MVSLVPGPPLGGAEHFDTGLRLPSLDRLDVLRAPKDGGSARPFRTGKLEVRDLLQLNPPAVRQKKGVDNPAIFNVHY